MHAMLGAASMVFFALAPVLAAVTWNMTLENHSPMITYEPYSDGVREGGWAIWSSDIGYYPTPDGEKTIGGQTASGTTAHVSSATSASFAFKFRGTAFTLYGSANASYTVYFDNHDYSSTPASPLLFRPGVLFEAGDLQDADHYVNLTLGVIHGNQQVDFERVVFTAVSDDELNQSTFNCSQTDVVKFTGSWGKDVHIPETPLYRETDQYQDSVQMTFNNARAVSAKANLNWGHWNYLVELDGLSQGTYNASTWWLIGDTVLFFQDNLDPTQEHTIKLTNVGNSFKFTFTSFSIWEPQAQANGDSPSDSGGSKTADAGSKQTTDQTGGKQNPQSSALSGGVIAGIIVGAIVAAAGIGLLIYWLARRQRRQNDGAHRIFPLIDEKGGHSAHSSVQGLPRTSPLLRQDALITPLPVPEEINHPSGYPARPPGLGSDQLSIPPSVSTEGGVAPTGARPPRTTREKKRQLQNSQRQRNPAPDASPTQSSFSGAPRSEGSAGRDSDTVNRVIEMLVQRIDTRPIHQDGAPPSYASDSGR